MKRIYFTTLIFFSIFCIYASGQVSAEQEAKSDQNEIEVKYPSLMNDAEEMAEAFKTNNFEKFASYMHPKLIAKIGGKESFINGLKKIIRDFEAKTLTMVEYTIKSPTQLIEQDSNVFTIMKTVTVIKVGNENITQETGLLGISENNGKDWKFIRVETKESIKPFFPNIIDKVKAF